MKSKKSKIFMSVYVLFLMLSIFTAPLVVIMIYGEYNNSQYFYADYFDKNRSAFETYISDGGEFEQDSKKIVCDIQNLKSDKNELYTIFYMVAPDGTPSDENRWRGIVYCNSGFPSVYNSDHNKQLDDNWFYIANYQNNRFYIWTGIAVLYAVIWLSGIIILIKKLIAKNKKRF